jgi:hypothetical protein
MVIVLSTLLMSIVGCTKQDTGLLGSNDNFNELNMKSLVIHEGTIPLKGFTRFAFTATKEGLVITDGYTMNFLECTAELTFSDNKNFTLHTWEVLPVDPPVLYREITFNGKIAPGGALKFSWPETWWELGTERGDVLSQVREHTGMVISGQGINKNTLEYMGYFKGDKLFADMHIVGLQEVPGTMPFFAEIVDGPVLINFMIDLEVSE